MERDKIEKVINKLHNIAETSNDDDFNLALYIYVRYGIFEFDNYICDKELEEINQVLKRYSTIFNEDINDEVSIILNDTEED